MFNKGIIYLIFFTAQSVLYVYGDEVKVEVACNINVKKSIHRVNDKFLSISVDPAVLLAGVNLSENSLRLSKHFSPAFIRLAGPSTQFVKYVDQDGKSENLLSEDGSSLKITSALWFGVNEWLKLSKLTPIFGINDAETARGLWNPKTTLPLFEISEKLNFSCYWQLGYDSSYKNETRYKQDINILHYILTAYGARNDTWKIIGSDISTLPIDRAENIMMEERDVLEAVMWEPNGRAVETFPEKDSAYKMLLHQSIKPRTKMWTTVPKSTGPVTFASALLWAKQVGNAAKMGYDVIFRQPRIYELFTDTPVYWFSVLHKELMGCNVLETKSALFQEGTDIFAHCTRKQNSFVRRGALTVLIANDRQEKYKVKIKLGNSLPDNSMEIQSYILTSDSLNSTDIYLNGKLLTPKLFQEKSMFQPKIRRTKTSSHVLLSLPPASIGFFILPGARVPVCIDKEIETELLLQEIEENQNNGLSEEIALQLGPRASFNKNTLLEEITRRLKDELKSDENYYNKQTTRKSEIVKLVNEPTAADKKIDEKERRKNFLDRVKFADKHKKAIEFQKKGDNFKKLLFDKSKTDQKQKSMDLTSEEIEKILKDRAIERAAKKNIVFTDEELDALIHKASKNFNLPRKTRSLFEERKSKRSINMNLLEKYALPNPEHFDSKDENLKVRSKRNVRNIKTQGTKEKRGINFDLLDLKNKIADHKKLWQDKKLDLLGNSNSLKDGIKEKIRELKSKVKRMKRDINKDHLKKKLGSQKEKKMKVAIKKEVEATIRGSDQTSSEILEEWQHAHAVENHQDNEEVVKGEVFAELADSEDLELLDSVPQPKKHSLFDKKAKIDPFAVAHPTIDIVEPSRRKSSNKKKKSKSDDKLQFLTTSEEFTDIEDDLPFIHEFYGMEPKTKKKSSNKAGIQEMNELHNIPKLYKREIPRLKGSTGFTFLEMAKFDDGSQLDNIFKQLLLNPVLELPPIAQIYKSVTDKVEKKGPNEEPLKSHGNRNISNETSVKNETLPDKSGPNAIEDTRNIESPPTIPESNTEDIQLIDNILKKTYKIYDNVDDKSKENNVVLLETPPQIADQVEEFDQIEVPLDSTKYNSDESENSQKYDIAKEDLSQSNFEPENGESSKNSIELRRKRETKSLEKPEKEVKTKKHKAEKKPVKKVKQKSCKKENHKQLSVKTKEKKENKYLSDQLTTIRDKLQEKKDEIDKMLKKQKELEQAMKNEWKTKLAKKKMSKNEANELSELKSEESLKKNLIKRAILNPKLAFGNYHPPQLKLWKPSDIMSLKKNNIHFSKKSLPPDDSHIWKRISYNLNRKRRFIDTDVDPRENEIDGDDINDIKKEDDQTKVINYEYKAVQKINEDDNKVITVNTSEPIDRSEMNGSDKESFIKDGDYKFKLPNEDEFEIIKTKDDTEIKFMHHDHHTTNNADEEIDMNKKPFVPKISPRTMKPFEDIEEFFGNIKKLFDKVGSEVKYYFNNIGLRI